jgi:hypothetical protein
MRLFLSLMMLASLVLPAQAKPIPKLVTKAAATGQAYDGIRVKLKAQGWKTYGTSIREDGGCLEDDARCTAYPEAEACSGAGLGYCNMVWRHRDGTLITIVTGGEEPMVVVKAKTGKP